MLHAGRYQATLAAVGDIGDRLRSLLVDLGTCRPRGPLGAIEVFADAAGGFVIRSDGRVWNDEVPDADVADQVVRMLLQAALDAESEFVHIHAGAVALGDRTAILAGWPASGKSTAITALVSAGFSYVTDERLVLTGDGRGVAGFPKPISLIAGSFGALAHLDPQRTGRGASSGTTWQIPASAVGPVASQESRAPSLLVFITYRPDVALRVVDVAPHKSAARLLGDSPDVIIRGHSGAHAIVSLVSSIRCVELEYSATDEMVTAMRDLLDRSHEFEPREVTVLKGAAAPDQPAPLAPSGVDTTSPYAIVHGVSAWIINDDAVAYVHRTGRVIELDAAGAAWLQLLDEHNSVDELINEVADATATDRDTVGSAACDAVHGLWSAGVVGPMDGTPRGR